MKGNAVSTAVMVNCRLQAVKLKIGRTLGQIYLTMSEVTKFGCADG